MKHIFILSFLLMALAITARADDEDVVDTSGETVTPFDEYYILPSISASGGGLSLADTANKTCTVDVIKEISEAKNGMSLKFTLEERIGLVPTSTRLNISFADAPECAQSSDWILVKENEKWFVGIGGPENHPGRETMEGWFKIEKYGEGYKIMFCQHRTSNDCGNIGIDVDENKNKRLALISEGAYEVVFQKAN